MDHLPTGTVTFLFSDIEGSTRLIQRAGDRFPAILEDHHRLVRERISARGGVELGTEGDSFFVVFPTAPQAVAAAIEAQRALSSHRWPSGADPRVRMGLHTGEGTLGGDNYTGVDVHRAARVAAAAHGGQILLSGPTASLVERVMPEGASLRDLGEHHLRDLAHPEHLFQVMAPGLPSDFPPPVSVETRRGNLPRQLTTFIGRGRELEEVKERLGAARLLTLTGPGGTGKTRLSIQAAGEVQDQYEGAYFVPLAPITDPGLVPTTIADALGLSEVPGREPIEVVIDHLAGRKVLLVLDNFEQVLPAAEAVGEVLSASGDVTVLATSREPLRLAGEQEYPVPPLGLPDPSALPPLESLSQYEAVALFIERARAVRPRFGVTEENAPAIAEIVSRLDGLPLAIELAAARSRILTPQAMLKRLDHRLSLLAGGARDLPARQRTLRDAIAWSYDLLEPPEAALFARLSVYVDGFTLESVEAVCDGGDGSGLDPLEGVESLANKSLLRQMDSPTGESRFFMLETIREYAGERLAGSPEADEVARRHADHFLALARRATPLLFGHDRARWLDAMTAEHDNFRAALAWAQGAGQVETALWLAASLWRFWQMRGHLVEGRDRLAAVLELPGTEEHPEAKAEALEAAGGVTYWMAETTASRRYYEECLDIRRRLGDPRGIAQALYNLSFPYTFTRREYREPDRAMPLLEEALGIFRELGDEEGVARTLWGLGDVYVQMRRYREAEPYLGEALDRHRELGDRFGMSWDLFMLGVNLLNMGRLDEAEGRLVESLSILSEGGDLSGLPLVLGAHAALATERGDAPRAVRLAAAARVLERASGAALMSVNEEFEGWTESREALVPPDEYRRLWAEGEAMSADQAVAYALEASTDR
jgi:predicted ATPase/class 3 adenylate cyclase